MADHDSDANDATGDWRAVRHTRRLRQRRLPHGLREDVERVRRDDLAEGIMNVIFEEVRAQAGVKDLVTIGDAQVVMPVIERRVLRELNRNAAFRGRVLREIAGVLRSVHLMCVDPAGATSVPSTLGPVPRPQDGVLGVRSSIGLDTATFLEAEPEGWAHYVVSCLLDKWLYDDADIGFEKPHVRIYSVGAGAGSIARIVTAIDAPIVIEVEEQDTVLGKATALPCVVGNRDACSSVEKFDAVVMVLPAPAAGGAANHRRIYDDKDDSRRWLGDGHEKHSDFDVSRFGRKRWLYSVTGWLEAAADVLVADGQLFVLAPAGVREARGHVDAPELLERVVAAATSAGLRLHEKLRVVEFEPVAQPFIGTSRPERWSLQFSLAPSSEAMP
jgi:hypothetical protein